MGFLNLPQHRLVRAPQNPLDKSTIISIFPKEIVEVKITLQPSKFVIPAGTYDNPSSLVVTSAAWWKEVGPDDPPVEITHSSIVVADSIVKDYINGLLGCNMGDKMPGIFWVPGEIDSKAIKTDPKIRILLDRAKQWQTNWFMELVKLADILWSRTGGNPISIGDDMRMAAEQLQITDKPWLKDFVTVSMVNCPACGFLRNNNYPVCSNCHAVLDKKKFDELGLQMLVK